MRYLTLITIIEESDEESAKQHCNGIKTWRNNVFVQETHLHTYIIGDRDTKQNVAREMVPACSDIKISHDIDWLQGLTEAQAINKIISTTESSYIGILPFQSWREPLAIQNQLSVLRNVCDFTYGDYVRADDLNQVFDNVNKLTVFEKTYEGGKQKNYYRQNNWGHFTMWRKSIHDTIGYFDEKFSDSYMFDLVNRIVSTEKMKIIKTPGIMGASCRLPVRNQKEESEIIKRFSSEEKDEKKPITIVSFGKETEWQRP